MVWCHRYRRRDGRGEIGRVRHFKSPDDGAGMMVTGHSSYIWVQLLSASFQRQTKQNEGKKKKKQINLISRGNSEVRRTCCCEGLTHDLRQCVILCVITLAPKN